VTRQEKARARRLALYAVTLAFVVFLIFRVDWERVQTARAVSWSA
jgi:hypothetical protein